MNDTARKMAIGILGSRPMQRLFRPVLGARASIFMLHRFADPELGIEGHDPALLRRCLERLRSHKVPVLGLADAIERVRGGAPLPPGAVMFTMDDGFRDQGDVGAELFLAYDVPVTLFMISGLQDGLLWPWDDRLAYLFRHSARPSFELPLPGGAIRCELAGEDDRQATLRDVRARFKRLPFDEVEPSLEAAARAAEVELPRAPPAAYQPLGWAAARRLEARGVQFGPHSISHGIVSRMNDETARRELLGAWDRLRAELAAPVRVYGWPTGRAADFTPRDIAILREHGFRGAVATDDDYADFGRSGDADALFRLRRFAMPAAIDDFIQYSTGIERAKQLARARLGR